MRSEETSQPGIDRPKWNSLSYWTPGTTSTLLYPQFLDLRNTIFSCSRTICVPRLVASRTFFVILLVKGCYVSFFLRFAFLRYKYSTAWKTEIIFTKRSTRKLVKIASWENDKMTVYNHQYKKLLIEYFHFSCLYFFLGGKSNCLHAKSKYK